MFLSAEILPNTYKIIRKDRSLGGGGVFIGFKNLQLSEVTTPTSYVSDAEMIWGNFTFITKSHCTFVLSTGPLIPQVVQL